MPLNALQVDIEARKQAGHDAAIANNATETKPIRDGLIDDYPYTYWWIVGYNEAVSNA